MIRTRQVALCATILTFVACAARAELAGDVSKFLTDRDRLIDIRAEINDDRERMALDLDNPAALEMDVRNFFADRQEAHLVRLLKKADRRQMKITLNYVGPKIAKPTKRTGVLLTDATSYINAFDAWSDLGQAVEAAIRDMRTALNANDNAALVVAATHFFDQKRARLEKRLQWQSDIRAMKKDIKFKGTGKPVKPGAGNLRAHVVEFLADREAWSILEDTVNADRNNLRAAINGSASIDAIVFTFLTDRRARHVKNRELQFDRKAMRKDLKLKNEKGELKPGAEVKSKDLDSEDELGALDESADTAGEK